MFLYVLYKTCAGVKIGPMVQLKKMQIIDEPGQGLNIPQNCNNSGHIKGAKFRLGISIEWSWSWSWLVQSDSDCFIKSFESEPRLIQRKNVFRVPIIHIMDVTW